MDMSGFWVYCIMSLLFHQVEYLLLELVEDLQLLTLLVEASLTVLMVLMTEYRHSSSYLSTLQVIGRLWGLVLATLSSTVLVQGSRLQPSLSTQPMILQRWSRLTTTTRAEASLTWTSLYSELKSLQFQNRQHGL